MLTRKFITFATGHHMKLVRPMIHNKDVIKIMGSMPQDFKYSNQGEYLTINNMKCEVSIACEKKETLLRTKTLDKIPVTVNVDHRYQTATDCDVTAIVRERCETLDNFIQLNEYEKLVYT